MGLISRVSSRTYRFYLYPKMTKIVSTTHNCHCEVTSSKVSAKFSNMRLHGGIRVKVDQHMRIRLPLSTDCECHEVGADSDVEQAPKKVTQTTVQSPPKPAPKPQISRSPSVSDNKKITVFLNARDLPKMDSFLEGGSCDPYYVFLLDQGKGFKKVSGGPHLAIKNQRKGAWSFVIAEKEIANSTKTTLLEILSATPRRFWQVVVLRMPSCRVKKLK